MPKAQLCNVNKNFGQTRVLKDINLSMAAGEFITFVGPSGSGKSTLLRVVSGLEPVSSGTVFIGERDVTEKSPKERNISMVFQNYALYPHMSVEKNITFGMRIRREDKTDQEKALKRVVNMLHLEGLLERKPRQLSGGQRQRVAMARAIVHTPDLFLMDEPLSNLDAKLRNDVRLSIMELHKELGCTMVYVTHDQTEAMTMADRIVVLNEGIIQQIGTPQELYHRPINMFTADFIGMPGMNFISLTRINGRFCLPDGIHLPLSPRQEKQFLLKDEIILGIRPEHIFCMPDGDEQIPQVTVVFHRTIISFEMLGSEFLVHTEKDKGGVKYRKKNDGNLPLVGTKIDLYFDMAFAHFFDGVTGQKIN